MWLWHRRSHYGRALAKLGSMEGFASSYNWPTDVLGIFLRYLLFAGAAYYVFYVWRRKSAQPLKIQEAYPGQSNILGEIALSLSTLVIYSGVSWLIFLLWNSGYSRIYDRIDEFGLPYFFLSIAIMVILHDAYFYWTHRLLHLPGIYSLVHKTHHRSVNPTPWAAFAFHPLEAFVAAGIIPLIVLTIPCHPAALLVFLNYMTLISVMGHLGYEIFPGRLIKSRLGKWHNTATNHNLHHQVFKGNYGLYFTFWDRVMGTYSEIKSPGRPDPS